MTFTHVLGALSFVFGTLGALVLAWVAVRWVGSVWPNGWQRVEARMGPFDSPSVAEGVDRLRDRVQDIEGKLQLLESGLQLLKNEWMDAFAKMRRAEERIKKARQRAEADEYSDEETGPPDFAFGGNGEAPPPVVPLPPPPESPAMRAFRSKYEGRQRQ